MVLSPKPQPATASLFEWALNPEKGREVELVGTSAKLSRP